MTRGRYLLLFAGIAIFAALAFHGGVGVVARAFATLRLQGLAIATLIHLPIPILMALAWWSVGRDVQGATPANFIAARLVRDSVSETLPFSQIGGFLSGLRMLALTGADTLRGAFAMFADLVIEFSAKLLYALAGVLVLFYILPGSTLIRPFIAVLACAIAILVTVTLFRGPIMIMLGNFAPRLIGAWVAQKSGRDLRAEFARFSWRGAMPCFAIHIGCWLFGAVEAWVTLKLMGIPVTAGQALVIDSVATTLRTFGFLVPAAIGVQEAGYVLACALFGIGPGGAVAFSLVRRARDILIAMPGLAAWQFLELRAYRRRFPVEASPPK
ncbi:MAG TPA: lysylphosphatidylglycerol synthase domain-containing protein [Rhizomicrobium sp.]|jgi:putative membrane protein